MMRLVILGAGTMGRGIAQVAAASGVPVTLVDPVAGAAERGKEDIFAAWERAERRGRLSAADRAAHRERLEARENLPAWAPDWVIEAVPEDSALKRRVLADVQRAYGPSLLVASNTSSLALTSLQAGLPHPERVGGLHFFNPVPQMALVEVIAGVLTSSDWAAAALELVRRLGKTPVAAPDRPGFLVNRIARPYYGEALRMVDEGTASMAAVDAVMEAAGFPMGPFRLMDLVGVDVNLAVTESVYRQTFEDPRYRPHPVQVAMVQAGRLGRKSGGGFYDGPHTGGEPSLGARAGETARGLVLGSARFRAAWAAVASEAPWTTVEDAGAGPWDWVATDGMGEDLEPWLGPGTVALVDGTRRHAAESARRLGHREVYGIDPTLILAGSSLLTVAGPDPARVAAAIRPMRVVPVEDRLGHIFARTVSMLAAEALSFRPRQDPALVDHAVRLGLNHPCGPYEWVERLGARRLAAVLDALASVGGDRYRPGEDLRARAEQEES